MGKSFFIDLTRCTACRGCQIACKQWHKHPVEKTRNMGSYQNPQDLSFSTYKLVRFSEKVVDGELKWLFFPDQCRHCVTPPCKLTADMYDDRAILQDERTGAVIFTEYTSELDIDEIRGSCPYDIPRVEKETGTMGKCDMCYDRVHNGLKPACVQVCPTGAMNFGDREEMMDMAQERLAVVKKRRPKAMLADPNEVRVIILCEYDPAHYYNYIVAEATPFGPISRKSLLAGLARPFKAMTRT
ncbi:MAG: 4Fe-4S dicluster domain-containing protein [Desulfohalobiaceae bacterium]